MVETLAGRVLSRCWVKSFFLCGAHETQISCWVLHTQISDLGGKNLATLLSFSCVCLGNSFVDLVGWWAGYFVSLRINTFRTTPSQGGSESNGNERVLSILQSFSITEASTSDCLVPYPGQFLEYRTPQQAYFTFHKLQDRNLTIRWFRVVYRTLAEGERC